MWIAQGGIDSFPLSSMGPFGTLYLELAKVKSFSLPALINSFKRFIKVDTP